MSAFLAFLKILQNFEFSLTFIDAHYLQMLYIFLYILFTTVFIHIEGARPYRKPHLTDCSCRSKLTKSSSTDSLNNKNSIINASKTYSSISQCNFTLAAPKVIINPYKLPLENTVQQKPFGTFYLKCAACLAVAEQISQTINNTLEETEMNFVNVDLSEQLKNLCDNGFKNYDLRKFHNTTLITDRLKCTDHVESRLTGSWTKKLRELCNLYTAHMDIKHISNIYKNNTDSLAIDLCRGSGIFRDCQNLEAEDITGRLKDLECEGICECEK